MKPPPHLLADICTIIMNSDTILVKYSIVGYFRMVGIFVYFILKSIIQKLKLPQRHYLELYKYKIRMGIIIVCTKICTNKNYLLYIRYAAYTYGSNFNTDFESLEINLSNGAIKVQIKAFANFPG